MFDSLCLLIWQQNILVTEVEPTIKIKLSDFGLAKVLAEYYNNVSTSLNFAYDIGYY